MKRRLTIGIGASAALAILLAAGVTRAEVGVIHKPGRVDRAYPYVQTVVDEPDPFGMWFRISADGDARRRVLNADGDTRGDGPPAVAFNSVWQVPIVLWSRNGATGPRIVASAFVDGAWEQPVPINTLEGEQFDPAIAIAPNGTLHVVFWQIHAGQYEVRHQSLGVLDGAWTLPVRVSVEGEVACRPSIAIHDGTPRIVYEVHPNGAGTTPKEVTLAERPQDTSDFSSVPIVNSVHDGALWPQVHSQNGALWIDWIDLTSVDNAFDGEMAWVKLSAQGDWTPVAYEVFTSEEQRDYHTRGAIRWSAAGLAQANQTQTPPGEIP